MPAKERYDVVIVGAGAFGLASAFHLSERRPELSLLVVDARAGPGEGSMGASAAMVRDVFSSPDNRTLARASIAFYRHLMGQEDALRTPVPLLDLYGYLWLLPTSVEPEYRRLVAESGGTLDARFVPLEGLRRCPGLELAPKRWYEEDHASPPEPIVAGLFGRNCGAVAPEMLARYYHAAARARGVEFAFNTVVQRLSFEGREELLLHADSGLPFGFQDQVKGRLRIARVLLAGGHSVGADHVIVAGGAWSERILHPIGVATGCSPRPESQYAVSGPAVDELLAWVPPVEPLEAPGGRPRMPFVIVPTGATLKPIFREKRIWIGRVDTVAHPIGTREDPARDGKLEFEMASLGSREAYATDTLPAVTPYLPALGDRARLENAWGGYYGFSPDGLPVLVTEPFGVTFIGGDSGSGIMKADSLGRLVAATYEGKREATLFSGEVYRADRLSLAHRDVEEERIIL